MSSVSGSRQGVARAPVLIGTRAQVAAARTDHAETSIRWGRPLMQQLAPIMMPRD
jgi:hypothetical protein